MRFTIKGGSIAIVLTVLLVLEGCGTVRTNTIPEAAGAATAVSGAAGAQASPEAPKFTLGPGDELSIMVWRNEELNQTLKVNPTGMISFPFIGEFKVEGLTPGEVAARISKGISSYIVDPQVAVNVTKIESRKVFVLGEVKQPGVLKIGSPISSVEAISLAGGFTEDANMDQVLLLRGGLEKQNLHSLNLGDALTKGEFGKNVDLYAGDILYVPAEKISDMDRFFTHLANILRPFVLLEHGVILAPITRDALHGESARTVISTP